MSATVALKHTWVNGQLLINIKVETQLTLQLLVQVIPVKPDETESDVKKLIQYLPKSTDVSKSKAKTV
ncbi:7848_t:CDS:2 [Entrophospora sp. SA101]|nr:7848_t:CDS:2 [Entrophospora sp. SA101]